MIQRIMMVVGGLFLCASAGIFSTAYFSHAGWVDTTATVVQSDSHNRYSSHGTYKTYSVEAEYAVDGKTYTYKTAQDRQPTAGSKLYITYDPKNPAKNGVPKPGLYVAAALMLVPGFGFLLGGRFAYH